MDPWLFLPFCPDDLEAVVAIESQSFEQPWKRRALEGEQTIPGALAFVLKERPVAGVAGFVTVLLGLLIGVVHTVRTRSRGPGADADNGAARGGGGL